MLLESFRFSFDDFNVIMLESIKYSFTFVEILKAT